MAKSEFSYDSDEVGLPKEKPTNRLSAQDKLRLSYTGDRDTAGAKRTRANWLADVPK